MAASNNNLDLGFVRRFTGDKGIENNMEYQNDMISNIADHVNGLIKFGYFN